MKRIWLVLTLALLCLLLGCRTIPDHPQTPSADDDTVTAALEMPDEMKELSENPKVGWMVGMLAVLEDSKMICGMSSESFEVFTDPGDVIRATVIAQNGLDRTQPFDLMVFADGIPVMFRVGGEEYLSYPIDLIPEQKAIAIEFEKDFSLNLGRLDFVLSYAENPQVTYHLVSYTVWIRQDDEALAPDALCTTVEQREGLRGNYTGEVYDAWIWNEGVLPADIDSVGARVVSLQPGETILLEAVAAKPGLYRTVLVVNGNPVTIETNGTQYPYLDWESTGTNMIQLPVKIADMPTVGSMYTVTTPLDADASAQQIAASGRIELTENKGGNNDGTAD